MTDIMNVAELAKYLRTHRSTIYRLLRRGNLPAFKIGSDWRFRKEAIDTWMVEQEKHAATVSDRR